MTNINFNYNETTPFSDTCAQVSMSAAGVVETYTVPGAATVLYQARFAYTQNSNVYVRLNAAPTSPPAGTTTTETYSEFRPGADGSKRFVKGGDVLQFVTPDASAYVGVSLQILPTSA